MVQLNNPHQRASRGHLSSPMSLSHLLSNLLSPSPCSFPLFYPRSQFGRTLTLFQQSLAPFSLNVNFPVALIVIDYISFDFDNWLHYDFCSFHDHLRDFLRDSCLPISKSKSLSFHRVKTELVPFIGFHIYLVKRMIFPMPDKITKIAAFAHSMNLKINRPTTLMIVASWKLLLYSILNRSILSAFQK